MAATTGNATVSFGAAPTWRTDASVTITGQTGILVTSYVEAWIRLEATADHSVDEHRVEPLKVTAGNIVAGTGFTIYMDAGNYGVYGDWKVNWVWV